MESSQNNLKSLKDTVLEYAVLNMDFFFPTEISNADNIAPIPTFPGNLFKEILERSKDMCWPISLSQLRQCLAAKERLRWSDGCVLRFGDYFKKEDLELFKDRMHTLQTLTLGVYLVELTDLNFLNELSKAAGSLKHVNLYLDMSYTFEVNHMTEFEARLKEINVSCVFQKLRQIRIDIELKYFPFTLNSNVLTGLELNTNFMTRSYLTTFVGFKQLIHLSLRFYRLDEINLEDIIEAVSCLKNLRNFSLNAHGHPLDELMLNKIMKDMENLDILHLNEIILDEPNRLLKPKRKLNVLSYLLPSRMPYVKVSVLFRLAHKVGYFDHFKHTMTIALTTLNQDLYNNAIKRLFLSPEHSGMDYFQKLNDAEKAGTFFFRSPMRLSKTIYSGTNNRTYYNILQRLVCFGMNDSEVCHYKVIKKFVIDYVKHNENTHLAKRFARSMKTLF